MTAGSGDVLIDTSGWVQIIRRKGDAAARDWIKRLIATDRAVWCDVIQLELWRGVASESDGKTLGSLASEIRSLPMSPQVWKFSFMIAGKCRSKGLSISSTDLMIYACAKINGVDIYHLDKHFDFLEGIELA